MQIWAGGKKLSDTKVGKFDRGPLLLRLSAMQPTIPTSIITDPVIRNTVTCCQWNRPRSQEREKQSYFISLVACAFPSLVVVRKWTNGYHCWRGKSPIFWPAFLSWCYFLPTRQEMKFFRTLYHLLLTAFFSALPFLSEYPFSGSKKKKKQLYTLSPNRGLVSSNNMPSTSDQIHT